MTQEELKQKIEEFFKENGSSGITQEGDWFKINSGKMSIITDNSGLDLFHEAIKKEFEKKYGKYES